MSLSIKLRNNDSNKNFGVRQTVFQFRLHYCLFFFFLIQLFVYFGSAGSSLLCRLFSIFREWGVLSTCITRAFHCGGFSCCRTWALRLIDFRRCSPWAHSCDAGAQWLCGMWDPPGTGIESVSPALAGRLNAWTTMEALRFRYFLSAVLGKLLSFLSLLFPVCPF